MKGINDRKMMMGLLSNMNKRKNIMSDEECKEKAPAEEEEVVAEETLFNDTPPDMTVEEDDTREDVILKLTQAIMDAPYIKRRPYGADINGDGEVEVSGMKLEELPDDALRELAEAFL